MEITIKHECAGKENLQNALIRVLIARMQQIGSVDLPVQMDYDEGTHNETINEELKEGVA